MALSGAQRGALRGRGQRLPVGVTVGRDGATEAVIKELKFRFERDDLIKVRFTAKPDDRKAAAESLAQSVGGEVAGVVGHTALIYREKRD